MTTAKMGKAVEIPGVMKGRGTGEMRLYRLDPPMPTDECYRHPGPYEYVVVSATEVCGEAETYIFPADEAGNVTDWGELPGSFQGGWDHERALNGAGYESV